MKRKAIAKITLLLTIGSLITACGGGHKHSGAETIPNFRGTWDITFTTEKNDCDASIVGNKDSVRYTITQDGKNIALHSEDGSSVSGATDGDDSFSATSSDLSGGCTYDVEIKFDSLSGNTAIASFEGSIDCKSEGKCSIATNRAPAVRE